MIVTQEPHEYQLSEFRDHCRISHLFDDAALQRSLDSGVQFFERLTDCYQRRTTCTYPAEDGMLIPAGPMPVMVAVNCSSSSSETLNVTADWKVKQTRGGFVLVQHAGPIRSDCLATLEFDGIITPEMKICVYEIGNHFFRNRGATIEGVTVQEMPFSVRTMVENFRKGGI